MTGYTFTCQLCDVSRTFALDQDRRDASWRHAQGNDEHLGYIDWGERELSTNEEAIARGDQRLFGLDPTDPAELWIADGMGG